MFESSTIISFSDRLPFIVALPLMSALRLRRPRCC
jgi:hypothetical protein